MIWNTLFLLAIVIVLTYDPKSRTLEKIVGQPLATEDKPRDPTHYEAVHFAIA